MTDLPTQYPGLLRAEKFAPREQFSISQIEKAFGAGYECLDLQVRYPYGHPKHAPANIAFGAIDHLSVVDTGPSTGSTGCLRSWGYRYLGGIKQPEYTWEEACALPEHTEPLRRLKGGAKAKTWGKVAEREIERFLTNDPSLQTRPLDAHVLVGLHLLPHPRDMVRYELQQPIRVRTNPETLAHGLNAPARELDPDAGISWQGFKDFTPTLWTPISGTSGLVEQREQRYLIDFKTTKPIVNKKENVLAGRAPNAWAYMKDANKLRLDWQYNLYEWDEYVTHGSLVGARWVYFASPGTEQYPNKPEARATDMPTPDLEIVRSVVLALDARARVLRDYIRQSRSGLTADDLPANTLACSAYGGCPYRSAVGGPCNAESTQIIPMGRVTARARSVKAATHTPTPIGPGFTFDTGATHMSSPQAPLSLMDQIKQQQALMQGAAGASSPAVGFAPGQPPAAAAPHAPGYPLSAAAHVGAPVPTAGLPGVFPAAAPGSGAPAGVPGGPFNPAAFSFGAPQAPPPPPAPAPAIVPGPSPFGAPSSNPEYLCDGAGGYFAVRDAAAMLAAGHPEAVGLWGTPAPAAAPTGAVLSSPTPGLPPEAFAPGGPAGAPAPVQAVTGSPAPVQVQTEKRKRRTKAEMEADARALVAGSDAARDSLVQGFEPRDTTPPAPHTDRVYIRIDTGAGVYYAVPAPAEISEHLREYARGQLGISG